MQNRLKKAEKSKFRKKPDRIGQERVICQGAYNALDI